MLYFGYGSLVNRATRDASEPYHKASLHGWERQWAHRARRPWRTPGNTSPELEKPGVCALTVATAVHTSVDGVLGHVDDSQVAALDQRESGYHRVVLPVSDFTFADAEDEQYAAGLLAASGESHISVYVSAPEHNDWADPDYPILMSYVECVLAGFRQQYGEAGAGRFMQTTAGWDRPLFDDRHEPLYPRAVTLTAAERDLVETLLATYTD